MEYLGRNWERRRKKLIRWTERKRQVDVNWERNEEKWREGERDIYMYVEICEIRENFKLRRVTKRKRRRIKVTHREGELKWHTEKES